MGWILLKAAIAGVIVAVVSEIANRTPRFGALLLTLPLVSILAFIFTWTQHRELTIISRLAKETLVLVPLGLPFFIPLDFANRLGIGFWPAFAAGVILASATIGLWFWLGPKTI